MDAWFSRQVSVTAVQYDGVNWERISALIGDQGTVLKDQWDVGEPLYIELDRAMLRADPGEIVVRYPAGQIAVYDADAFNALFSSERMA